MESKAPKTVLSQIEKLKEEIKEISLYQKREGEFKDSYYV